jgi:hypothetical protein
MTRPIRRPIGWPSSRRSPTLLGAEEGERVDFGGKAEAIEILAVEAIAA